ncbi:hypothetical protein ACFVVC_04635 [Pseudarthrobacter sp. NPDC058196]|uniref:hypothetical protein n=1 Tax=Pseudarthrobacter sp. NPDC058196 TaxID=3346376 RepID=UPI0036DF5C2F
MKLRVREDRYRRPEQLPAEGHMSKSALLLQGAELLLKRHSRRRENNQGLDIVTRHDTELLTRLKDT